MRLLESVTYYHIKDYAVIGREGDNETEAHKTEDEQNNCLFLKLAF